MADGAEFDLGEIRDFCDKLRQAAGGDLRAKMELFIQGLGAEFLRLVEDEIVRREVVDTRLLLASFSQGHEDGVWETGDEGLTLEVGTNVSYAAYVNDGHWTNPKGVESRFVPGSWEGGRFVYEPGAKTGMVLKQKWVEGAHYWESAVRILEKMLPEILDAMLQDWLDGYFG